MPNRFTGIHLDVYLDSFKGQSPHYSELPGATRVPVLPSNFQSIFRPSFFRLLPPKWSPSTPKILPKSTKKRPSDPSRHEPPKSDRFYPIFNDFRKCRCASRTTKTNENERFFYWRLVRPLTEKTSKMTPKSYQNPLKMTSRSRPNVPSKTTSKKDAKKLKKVPKMDPGGRPREGPRTDFFYHFPSSDPPGAKRRPNDPRSRPNDPPDLQNDSENDQKDVPMTPGAAQMTPQGTILRRFWNNFR